MKVQLDIINSGPDGMADINLQIMLHECHLEKQKNPHSLLTGGTGANTMGSHEQLKKSERITSLNVA